MDFHAMRYACSSIASPVFRIDSLETYYEQEYEEIFSYSDIQKYRCRKYYSDIQVTDHPLTSEQLRTAGVIAGMVFARQSRVGNFNNNTLHASPTVLFMYDVNKKKRVYVA
jgi:hypothetical protein